MKMERFCNIAIVGHSNINTAGNEPDNQVWIYS